MPIWCFRPFVGLSRFFSDSLREVSFDSRLNKSRHPAVLDAEETCRPINLMQYLSRILDIDLPVDAGCLGNHDFKICCLGDYLLEYHYFIVCAFKINHVG